MLVPSLIVSCPTLPLVANWHRRPGWWRNALTGLEGVGPRTMIPQQNWALTDSKGYALRSENETGGGLVEGRQASPPYNTFDPPLCIACR